MFYMVFHEERGYLTLEIATPNSDCSTGCDRRDVIVD